MARSQRGGDEDGSGGDRDPAHAREDDCHEQPRSREEEGDRGRRRGPAVREVVVLVEDHGPARVRDRHVDVGGDDLRGPVEVDPARDVDRVPLDRLRDVEGVPRRGRGGREREAHEGRDDERSCDSERESGHGRTSAAGWRVGPRRFPQHYQIIGGEGPPRRKRDTFLRRRTCSGSDMEPVLQVALDFMHAKRALQAAKEAVEGGADWIEAGTPLIKSEGVEILRQLRKMFPGRTIVADLKTMDTGAFEIEIAAKAGADVITVMGVTDDATIEEAVKAARRYGAKIMVDLMRVADKPARAKELEKLGVDYLNMHVSIDEQMIAHTPLQELKAVASATSLPVAVAGGLNSETVGEALKAGASIVIVGGAIIKAENVAEAARTIKKAMTEGKRIPTGLYKKYGLAEVRDAFLKVSTPNLADAMQKRGVMSGLVPRIKHGTKLVGRAVTVKTADGDWAKPVEAIDRAKAGDVIVIDVGGGPTAVWGELASNSC